MSLKREIVTINHQVLKLNVMQPVLHTARSVPPPEISCQDSLLFLETSIDFSGVNCCRQKQLARQNLILCAPRFVSLPVLPHACLLLSSLEWNQSALRRQFLPLSRQYWFFIPKHNISKFLVFITVFIHVKSCLMYS